MAVKSREELLNSLSAIIGEEPDDNGIAFMEDLTDTVTDFEERTKEDWKTKYEENDKAWKKKYTERFMKGSNNPPQEEDPEEPDEEDKRPRTFEELFKTED